MVKSKGKQKMASYCVIQTRNEILNTVENMFDYVKTNCFYCSYCFNCRLLLNLKREISRTGVESFNSDITFWSIDWIIKNYEYKPILTHYLLDGKEK